MRASEDFDAVRRALEADMIGLATRADALECLDRVEERYERLIRAARPFGEMAQEMLTGHPTGRLPSGAAEALLRELKDD